MVVGIPLIEVMKSSKNVKSRGGHATCFGLPWRLSGKEFTSSAGDAGLILWQGRFPGGGMATCSSILAREITWTEEPGVEGGGLQSMGSQRVRYN